MADPPDFRQMMDSLDEAFTEQLKTIFGNFAPADSENEARFRNGLRDVRLAYVKAAAIIEKEADAAVAPPPTDAKTAKTVKA